MRSLALAFVATTALVGPALSDALRDAASETFKPLPSKIPALDDTIITPEKIDRGKALFFDPRLSASGVFSCYSCHNLTTVGDYTWKLRSGRDGSKGRAMRPPS